MRAEVVGVLEIKKRKRKHGLIKVISMLMLALIALIGIPLLINIAFKIDAPFSFLIAEWTASDLLNFYGAVMVFLGTACLSALALHQNKVFKAQNDRLMQLQNAPYFSYVDLKFSESRNTTINIIENQCNFVLKEDTDTDGQIVTFDLENMSSYPIVSIEMQLQMFDNCDGHRVDIVGNKSYHQKKSIVISPGKGYKLSIGIGEKIWSNIMISMFVKDKIGIYLTYKNINNLETHGRIICTKNKYNFRSYKYVLIPMDYDFENE